MEFINFNSNSEIEQKKLEADSLFSCIVHGQHWWVVKRIWNVKQIANIVTINLNEWKKEEQKKNKAQQPIEQLMFKMFKDGVD